MRSASSSYKARNLSDKQARNFAWRAGRNMKAAKGAAGTLMSLEGVLKTVQRLKGWAEAHAEQGDLKKAERYRQAALAFAQKYLPKGGEP